MNKQTMLSTENSLLEACERSPIDAGDVEILASWIDANCTGHYWWEPAVCPFHGAPMPPAPEGGE